MPLSVQGNAVLSKMWDSFSVAYAENNPGSNMNDAEREFLRHLLVALVDHSSCMAPYSNDLKEAEQLIEKIR
jgi:hypothetical protein